MSEYEEVTESAVGVVGMTLILISAAAFFIGGLVTFSAIIEWLMENATAYTFGPAMLGVSVVAASLAWLLSWVVS